MNKPAAIVPIAAIALALALCACSGKHTTRPPVPETAPVPDSPVTAVRLLQWSWSHRDTLPLADVTTGDFEFVFALRDSAGNPSRDPPLSRDALLCAGGQLFHGGGSQPPATSIALLFDATLDPMPDSRPGKHPRWHKEIVTGVDLDIRVEGGREYRISGSSRFFLVRGDSAVVPTDLMERGVRRDSTRWFVERWTDEMLGGGLAARPMPDTNPGLSGILALYRCPSIEARAR